MFVYFDLNVRPCLVAADVDPVAVFEGTEFKIAMTPDLRVEYETGLAHADVPFAEQILSKKLLDAAQEIGVFGFAEAGKNSGYSGFDHGMWMSTEQSELIGAIPIAEREGSVIPKHRTDAFLCALAAGAMVITNDKGRHWKRARALGYRVYRWEEVQGEQKPGFDLASCLRELGSMPSRLA